jgi:hypothetical protein
MPWLAGNRFLPSHDPQCTTLFTLSASVAVGPCAGHAKILHSLLILFVIFHFIQISFVLWLAIIITRGVEHGDSTRVSEQ